MGRVSLASRAVLSLELSDGRYALEVLAVRAMPHLRCGRPIANEARFDVSAALANVSGEAASGVLVPAACIVDADVAIE